MKLFRIVKAKPADVNLCRRYALIRLTKIFVIPSIHSAMLITKVCAKCSMDCLPWCGNIVYDGIEIIKLQRVTGTF